MEFISKDMEVSLKEKELELMQLVQEGEILPERMALELEKAQKDAVAKIEEQQAIIEAQLVELKTKVTLIVAKQKSPQTGWEKDINYSNFDNLVSSSPDIIGSRESFVFSIIIISVEVFFMVKFS